MEALRFHPTRLKMKCLLVLVLLNNLCTFGIYHMLKMAHRYFIIFTLFKKTHHYFSIIIHYLILSDLNLVDMPSSFVCLW